MMRKMKAAKNQACIQKRRGTYINQGSLSMLIYQNKPYFLSKANQDSAVRKAVHSATNTEAAMCFMDKLIG